MTYALAATPMIANVAEWRTYCAAGDPQGLNVELRRTFLRRLCCEYPIDRAALDLTSKPVHISGHERGESSLFCALKI
jgi:hypothetical protein